MHSTHSLLPSLSALCGKRECAQCIWASKIRPYQISTSYKLYTVVGLSYCCCYKTLLLLLGCHSSESPDNGVPIILSPQSEATRDTVNLVSSSCSSSGGSSPTPLTVDPSSVASPACSSSVPLLAVAAADCKESHV